MGIAESQVNERLQLTQVGLGTTATNNNLFKVDYEYGEISNDHTSVDTGKNVGMIARTTTTIPTTSFVQTYKYDAIARLTEMKEKTGPTTNWQQTRKQNVTRGLKACSNLQAEVINTNLRGVRLTK